MKFDSKRVPVPHIGWNYVDYKDDIFTRNLDNDQRYFFVHSYFYECADKKNSVGCTNYDDKFTSAVSNNINVFGTQFHPEKSHVFGKNLLKNYYEIY
jgi:glutamine amidotransferase